MLARGLVELRTGNDARQRLVYLTDRAIGLLPLIDREWAAYLAAIRELNGELSASLETTARELDDALTRRPFHERLAAHLAHE